MASKLRTYRINACWMVEATMGRPKAPTEIVVVVMVVGSGGEREKTRSRMGLEEEKGKARG